MKKYTLFHPDFNGGRDSKELAALNGVLANEDLLPFANYVVAQDSAPHKLSGEFLRFLCSHRTIKNPLFARIAQRNNWSELPLYACCLNSATSAITASLLANGITSGEVITASLNYIGVANAIIMAGATPKFVDINQDDFSLDVKKLAGAVNNKTRAIVLVHVNQVFDLAPLDELLQKKKLNIPIIQDASLALGSTNQGLPAGLINLGTGGTTVYSFATSKILSGLGGAVVVANDLNLISKIQSVAYQGLNFQHMEELDCFGANFKMCDLNAALVLEQLKKREAIFKKRRALRELYDDNLQDLVQAEKMVLQKVAAEGIITHYMVLLNDRTKIAFDLGRQGIQLGFWHSLHLQPIYKKRFKTKKGMLPVTESIADRITFLPFHTKLTEKDVQVICDALRKGLGG